MSEATRKVTVEATVTIPDFGEEYAEITDERINQEVSASMRQLASWGNVELTSLNVTVSSEDGTVLSGLIPAPGTEEMGQAVSEAMEATKGEEPTSTTNY